MTYFTVQNLVLSSYGITICHMLSIWLTHNGFISKFAFNMLRIISLIATMPVIVLLCFNHINVYLKCIPYPLTSDKSLCLLLLPFMIVFCDIMYHKSRIANVLAATIMTLPIYAMFLLFEPNGTLLTKNAPLMSVFSAYFITITLIYYLPMNSCFALLQNVSVYLCKHFKSYKYLLESLNDSDHKSHLARTITCGLIFSLLNFLQVYQNPACYSSRFTLFILAFSILAYAAVGCGLIDSGMNEKYYYNFVFQSILNHYITFKHVWAAMVNDQVPKFSLFSFSTVVLFVLVNTPIAYAMDPPLLYC